ncbi:MAG: GNAT family N-acetyltransferase [Prolixibacteraceae bacterium]|nr:GNAT family N-acetyltransferase [Prolixibacteraceae bacterium]
MAVKDDYIVRNMTAREVEEVAMNWAANEGWNPGLHDASVFYNTDPKGFFIGLLNDEPISCISAVSYNSNFGFIGFYIVKPGYRKEGYSIKLCRKAMQYLGERNIGLDGVVEQQDNYRKMGFKTAYKNIRYEGLTFKINNDSKNITPLLNSQIEEVVAFDSKLFPVPRPIFIKQWLSMAESYTMVARINGKINGYGTIRKCREGYKIGPLFADSYQTALDILQALVNSIPSGALFYLDIPDINISAKSLVDNLRMKKVFETARMYSKYSPNIDLNKVFGITSFELG